MRGRGGRAALFLLDPERMVLLGPIQVDLVIVEGFKRASLPKLEIYRESVGKPLLHPEDPNIVAIASDRPLPSARVPVLAIDDVDAILETMLARAAPVAMPNERAGSG